MNKEPVLPAQCRFLDGVKPCGTTGRELMPVENSRLSGFFRHTVAERRQIVAEMTDLTEQQTAALEACGALSEEAADRMIENVIGTMSLPVGVATNFVIDGKHYLIPFCLEESSVVAAASNMAKRCLKNGGFHTNSDAPMMIGQLQILECSDWKKAEQDVLSNAEELI